MTTARRATLTGETSFPRLISGPFHHGPVIVFAAAIAMSLMSAIASLLRGGRDVDPTALGDGAENVPGA